MTGSGSTCDPLIANVIISHVAGNKLVVLPDGVYASGGTGGGTPGGLDKYIQFNKAGVFGGSANLTWDNGAGIFGVFGDLALTNFAGDQLTFNHSNFLAFVGNAHFQIDPFNFLYQYNDGFGNTLGFQLTPATSSLVSSAGGRFYFDDTTAEFGRANSDTTSNKVVFSDSGVSFDKNIKINKANSATVAQLFLQPGGALLTTPVNGSIETAGNHIYYTAGGVRYQLDQQSGGGNFDATLALGGSLTANRTVTMAGNYIDWTGGYFKFHNIPNTAPLFDISAPAATPGLQYIMRVKTASTTNTVPWEFAIDNNTGGGPPDDNIAIMGWNIDARSDGSQPSWTDRWEYQYLGDYYEHHNQWSNAANTRTYRLFSQTFVDHGNSLTDDCLTFWTSKNYEFRTLWNGAVYYSFSNDPTSDNSTMSFGSTDNSVGFQFIGDKTNSVSRIATPSSVAANTLDLQIVNWRNIFFGGNGGNLPYITPSTSLMAINNFTTSTGTAFAFDNGFSNNLTFKYLLHTGGPHWYTFISNDSGEWSDYIANNGGYYRQVITTTNNIIMRWDPTNGTTLYVLPINLTGSSYLNVTSNPTATSGKFINAIAASSASGGFIQYLKNTTSTGYGGDVYENDRGANAGLDNIIMGSTATILDTTFGIASTHDWIFYLGYGAQLAGMAIGTYSAAVPLVFGTNNVERMRIGGAGDIDIQVGQGTPYGFIFNYNGSTPASGYYLVYDLPIRGSQASQVPFTLTRIASAQVGQPDNEIVNLGFNMAPNATPVTAGIETMGWSMESNYRPSSTRLWEWHQIFTTSTAVAKRLSSYTINTSTTVPDIDYYQTVHRFYIKNPNTGAVQFSIGDLNSSSIGMNMSNLTWGMQMIMNTSGMQWSDTGGAGAGRALAFLGFAQYQIGDSNQINVINGAQTQINTYGSVPVNFTFDGTHQNYLLVNASGWLTIQNPSTSQPTVLKVYNTNAAQYTAIRTDNDANFALALFNYGSTNPAYGAAVSNSGFLYSNHTAGLTIMVDDAAGVLRIAVGGNTEKARFSAAGALLINTTTDDGVNKLQVNGSIVATAIKLTTGAVNGYVLKSDASGNGTWQPDGGLTLSIVTKSANYTALTTDRVILVDATTGSKTITLPAPATTTGIPFTIKKVDSSANTVIISPALGLIEFGASATLSVQGASIDVISDGTAYYIY